MFKFGIMNAQKKYLLNTLIGLGIVLGFCLAFLIGLSVTQPSAEDAMDISIGVESGCVFRGMLQKDSALNADSSKLSIITGVGHALREVHVLDTLGHIPLVPGDVLYIRCHATGVKDTLADSIDVIFRPDSSIFNGR